MAVLAAVLVSCASAPPAPGIRVSALLQAAPLVDGHVDLVSHFVGPDGSSWRPVDSYDIGQRTKGQIDLPRLRAGRVGAAIFTIASLNEADREAGLREAAGLFRSLAKKYPDQLEIVTGSDGVLEAFHGGRIGALPGFKVEIRPQANSTLPARPIARGMGAHSDAGEDERHRRLERGRRAGPPLPLVGPGAVPDAAKRLG